MRSTERRQGGERFSASWEVLVGMDRALFPLGRTVNVSRRGMQVVARVPTGLREELDLTVRLPGNRLSRFKGTTVWSRSDQGLSAVGIEVRHPDVEWLAILNSLEGATRRVPRAEITSRTEVRTQQRVASTLHATYGLASANEYLGSATELSRAGLMLYGCESFPEGTELKIALFTQTEKVELAAGIVWGQPEETPNGFRMGVRLRSPSAEYLDLVSRLSPPTVMPVAVAPVTAPADEQRMLQNLAEMEAILARLRREDLCGAFGLTPSSSLQEFEKAFTDTMRRFHPARLPPAASESVRQTAQELLARATAARELLRDPARRAALLTGSRNVH